MEEVVDEFLLVGAVLEVAVDGPGLSGQLLGMVDEFAGLELDERQEVLASQFESAVDPATEVVIAAEGEIALENDSIVALKGGYNRIGESLRKAEVRRHGVLLSVNGTSGVAERLVIGQPAVAA